MPTPIYMLEDGTNCRVISDEREAESVRFIAWQMFMSRLVGSGFTVLPEYQEKWWGYRDDKSIVEQSKSKGVNNA